MVTREGPDGEERQINVSGVPRDYPPAMVAVADTSGGPRRGRLKRAYHDALQALAEALDRGERVALVGSTKGGARQTIWVREDLARRIDQHCRANAYKNRFVITAVERYLRERGRI